MTSIEQLVAETNKKYGSEILTMGPKTFYHERIPFLSPRVNYMTYGGLPVGFATEFLGAEGSGKTTLALSACAQAQKYAIQEWEGQIKELENRVPTITGKKELKEAEERLSFLKQDGPRKVVYFDLENTLDDEWARLNGVDFSNMVLGKPQDQTAEQVLQVILNFIESSRTLLLVIDSIPHLIPQSIYDEDMQKKAYAGVSGPMTEFCRRVSKLLYHNHTALVIINQIREDFNNPYNLYHSPGGHALKHLYGLRIACRKGTFIDADNKDIPTKNADKPSGNICDLTLVKTKVCKPDRRLTQYTIKYDRGIDWFSDTVYLAVQLGFIRQAGAWFYLVERDTGETIKGLDNEELRFQGMAKLLNYLQNDEVLLDDLVAQVNDCLTTQ